MTEKKTWFITGASRGMGVSMAKAVLAAGHNVVATARRPETVTAALGESENLLPLALDVTNVDQIRAAANTTLERFGRIDVLVNNAGYGLLGYFEEISLGAAKAQFDTNVFGTMEVPLSELKLRLCADRQEKPREP